MQQHENKQEDDTEPISLAEYIRRARERRNLSARQFAAQVRMHHSYISRLEAGDYKHPSPEKLRRIADVLGITYDDLAAMAGYRVPEALPSFVPYLRAKYTMTDQDVHRLSDYFALLKNFHGIEEKLPPHTEDEPNDSKKFVSWTEL